MNVAQKKRYPLFYSKRAALHSIDQHKHQCLPLLNEKPTLNYGCCLRDLTGARDMLYFRSIDLRPFPLARVIQALSQSIHAAQRTMFV